MIQAASPGLLLASGSVTRAALLRAAGLQFAQRSPGIDEAAIKRRARDAGATAEAAAMSLAAAKAAAITAPGAVVLGADQLLVCEGAWFDKPNDRDEARRQLSLLRGRTHVLVTATIAMRDGNVLWQDTATPELTMRDFSDTFLTAYLEAAGDTVLDTVGGYRLEELGAQLFACVRGEHAAILGLPLLPLLAFLRRAGILAS